MHSLFDPRPVFYPAMHLEDFLAHPAPALLSWMQRGGIGGLRRAREPGVARQGRQYVGVRMNVPVVLDPIEPVRRRIGAMERGREQAHLLTADEVAIEVVHLPGQGIERADRA